MESFAPEKEVWKISNMLDKSGYWCCSAAFHVRPIGGLLSLPFSRMDDLPSWRRDRPDDLLRSPLILAIVKNTRAKNTQSISVCVCWGVISVSFCLKWGRCSLSQWKSRARTQAELNLNLVLKLTIGQVMKGIQLLLSCDLEIISASRVPGRIN